MSMQENHFIKASDEPWKHHAKWYKPVTKGQILYNSSYIKYQSSQVQRDRKWNGSCQEGSRNCSIIGIKFQFCRIKRVLGMDGGDGCIKM